MRYAPYYAMAASVAALAVAAPMAFNLLRPTSGPTPGPSQPLTNPVIAPGSVPGNGPVDGRSAAGAGTKLALNLPRQDGDLASRQNGDSKLNKDKAPVPTEKLEAEYGARARLETRERPADEPKKRPALALVPAQQSAPAEGFVRQGVIGQLGLGGNRNIAPAIGFSDIQVGRKANGRIASIAPARPDAHVRPAPEQNRDQFDAKDNNPVKSVSAEPVSTFSIDVDTASYSFVRRALNGGRLPPKAAVRVEEMINYFPYEYARPDTAQTPFKPTLTVFPSPWNAANKLVHIAIKGYEIKSAERPRANLVFLVDVSGSMGGKDRLPLVRNSLRMLLDNLKPDDTVAIVTYASGSGVLLERTKVADKGRIVAAIDGLRAGGSTAGARGIQDAYRIAEAGFDTKAVNRVILATDGDFNVGITNRDELKGYIERKRKSGIFLSILGVGRGNYNDALMQTLAQNGNGTAAYVDTLNEARKVLVEEASSTLFPIAKDVKIQIEFNLQRVSEYRLIGYETRMLKREDFNNDKVDAGDVGSGHSVTAIYEVTPVGAPKLVDDLRYKQPASTPVPATIEGKAGELGFLKLRYKLPKEEASRLATFTIGKADERREIAEASSEARFSVAVAAFGQMLRGLPYMKAYTFDDVIALANGAKGADPFGYRSEFVNLVRLAKSARP